MKIQQSSKQRWYNKHIIGVLKQNNGTEQIFKIVIQEMSLKEDLNLHFEKTYSLPKRIYPESSIQAIYWWNYWNYKKKKEYCQQQAKNTLIQNFLSYTIVTKYPKRWCHFISWVRESVERRRVRKGYILILLFIGLGNQKILSKKRRSWKYLILVLI